MRTPRLRVTMRRVWFGTCVCALLLAAYPAAALAASVHYNRSLPVLGGDALTASCFIMQSGTAFRTIYNWSDPAMRKVRFAPCNESGSEITNGVELFPSTGKQTIWTNNGSSSRHVRIKMETVSFYTNHTTIDGTWYWTGTRHTP